MEFMNANNSTGMGGLKISFNPSGWGPVNGEKLQAFDDIPYAHFDKKEKCGRPADFVQSSQHNYQRPYYQRKRDGSMENTDFSYKHDTAEDSTFQLVDTSKTQSKSKSYGGMKRQGNRNQASGRYGRNAGGTRISQQQDPQGFRAKANQFNKRPNNKFKRNDRKQDRAPSLAVEADWEMVEEFDLAQLLKLAANLPVAEDLAWCGHLDQYDDNFDKLNTRISKPLRRIENKLFYDVSSSDDPMLGKFAAENLGNVFTTDSILATLMAAPRSVYSWDIVIQKVNDVIFLDKRDNSSFDFLTVSETAQEPPSASDEIDVINHPDKLSLEATMINQNFSQQVLLDSVAGGERKNFEANPFFDEYEGGTEPASVAYRYRKFLLGSINIVARTELHGWTNKRGLDQMMTCFAVHEWDSRYSGGVNWRQKIDQQRGAVLATELKNNSCKFAKWTAQSLLAGADQIKLGYVSRVSNTNPYEHSILATQFFKPKDLAVQTNLSLNNVWGIVKMLCELLMKKEDGKFILLKDPNKPIVRLYSVPLNTFEDDDEDDAAEGLTTAMDTLGKM